MSNYKLSICIPTYNRAKFIGETLTNIISQSLDDIEIVIVDGGSTDNTADVVTSLQFRFNNIHYYRQQTNNGLDADLARSVELAQGEYCWLMSSDDLLSPKAIQSMLKEITGGLEIYLCNIVACSKEMRPVKDLSWFSHEMSNRIFDFSRKETLFEYIAEARSIGALFSYMPAVVVRRAEWMSVRGADEFFGSCYAHVFTLFSIIQNKGRLKYISQPPLVLTRFGNDSFSDDGFFNRLLLDFEGYKIIADKLFIHDKKLKMAFLKVMTLEHRWYRIIKLKSSAADENEWNEMCISLKNFGYSNLMISICSFFGSFRNIIAFLVSLKKAIKPL